MQIGMIGLGRMGSNMVRRLMRVGHSAVVYDRTTSSIELVEKEGAVRAASVTDLVTRLIPPRVICLMVPAGAVAGLISELETMLARGDTLVDGGNSYYQDAMARYTHLATRGVHYVDMGTSGGVWGLENGFCLMIGGDADVVSRLDPMFAALAPGAGPEAPASGPLATAARGYLHCGPAGAGHFVKMVHNGIEYGLMAAYAEGLNILKHANVGNAKGSPDAETTPLRHPEHYRFDFDLAAVTELWRHGSVIRSWLLDLTAAAFSADGGLARFSGRVSDSGEGRWTLAAANEEGVPAHVLAAALFERFASRGEDDFQNRVLSAMRLGFGGHTERQ
jgi:6-phosphogluconate dehydrogenase